MKIRLHTILLHKFKKHILSPTASGPVISPAIPGFMQKSDLPEGSDHAGVAPNGCDNAAEVKQVPPAAVSADFPKHHPYKTLNISPSLPVNAANRSDVRTDPADTSFFGIPAFNVRAAYGLRQ